MLISQFDRNETFENIKNETFELTDETFQRHRKGHRISPQTRKNPQSFPTIELDRMRRKIFNSLHACPVHETSTHPKSEVRLLRS